MTLRRGVLTSYDSTSYIPTSYIPTSYVHQSRFKPLLIVTAVLVLLAIDLGTPTAARADGNDGPSGLTLEVTQPLPSTQDVYISDPGNNDVVEIAPNGTQKTLGSGFDSPEQIAVNAEDDLFVADMENNRVEEVTPAGVQTTVIKGLDAPTGVAVDNDGDVFVSDTGKNKVLEVSASGTVTTVVSGLAAPAGLAVDPAGDLFIANTGADQIVELTTLGNQTTVGTGFNQPFGVTLDAEGNVYVTDSGNEREVEVTPAGDGVEPVIAKDLMGPIGSAVAADGDVYITEFVGDKVLVVEPGGTTTTIGTGFADPYGVALGPVIPPDAIAGQPVTLQANAFPPGSIPPTGTVEFFNSSTLLGESALSVTPGATGGVDEATLSGTGLPIGLDTVTARYLGDDNYPGSQASATIDVAAAIAGLTVHVTNPTPSASSVYIADTGNNRVVEVSSSGAQTVVPATGLKSPEGVAVDQSGDVFIADSGNNRVVKVSSSGVQSTLPFTGLDSPMGIGVDAAGNVYVVDSGNTRVLKLTPAGVQSTVSTPVPEPTGLAVDAAGDIFLADQNDNRIVEVSAEGVSSVVSTQRGGTPLGVAVGPAGTVYAAYTQNDDVVRITPSGTTTSVLSTGLDLPEGVAEDLRGDTFVADTGNNRVVRVTSSGVETTIGKGLDAPADVAVSPTSTSKVKSGAAVTLTADLTPAGAGAPTGSVTFDLGSTQLGAVTLELSPEGNDVAALTTTTLPIGTDTVVATYSGDETFASATGSCAVVVTKK
jgi:large repetitive protein